MQVNSWIFFAGAENVTPVRTITRTDYVQYHRSIGVLDLIFSKKTGRHLRQYQTQETVTGIR